MAPEEQEIEMASKFTRKELREIIGDACTDEIENRIMALHRGVVDPMLDDIADLKAKAEALEAVTKERDELKAGGDYKQKYEDEHKAFEDYKKDITAKETRAAKEAAARAYFTGKGITGANLEIAVRGAAAEIDAAELDGDKIKDTKALDELVGGTFKGLVVTTGTAGANTPHPNTNAGGGKMTRAEIYKKDDKGHYVLSTAERQKALAENPDLL
jgi:hypothetical protein